MLVDLFGNGVLYGEVGSVALIKNSVRQGTRFTTHVYIRDVVEPIPLAIEYKDAVDYYNGLIAEQTVDYNILGDETYDGTDEDARLLYDDAIAERGLIEILGQENFDKIFTPPEEEQGDVGAVDEEVEEDFHE